MAPELASGHAAAPPLHHGSDEFLIDRAFFQPPVCDRPSGSTRRWRHIPVASRKLVGPRISPSPIRRPAICRCESSRISKRLRGPLGPNLVGSIPTLAVEPDTAMILPSSPQVSVFDAGCSPSGFWMSVIPNAFDHFGGPLWPKTSLYHDPLLDPRVGAVQTLLHLLGVRPAPLDVNFEMSI